MSLELGVSHVYFLVVLVSLKVGLHLDTFITTYIRSYIDKS
jgi:hypothetical protein